MEATETRRESWIWVSRSQPLRRIGRPEDIADLALFLASDRAAHVTGQLVSVSGGSYMP